MAETDREKLRKKHIYIQRERHLKTDEARQRDKGETARDKDTVTETVREMEKSHR